MPIAAGWLHGSQEGFSSPSRAEDNEQPLGSPTQASPREEDDNPPLQEAASPVVRSIPFMQTAAASAHDNELSLEGWAGAGPFGGQGFTSSPHHAAEGWGEDDLSWLQHDDGADMQL